MKAIRSLSYQSPFSSSEIRVIMSSDSFWLTQLQMSQLFGCDVRRIHVVLKALFASGELDEDIVNQSVEIENYEGHFVSGNFYNLDAIIAVGYRIDPREATHFHIWSTQMLRYTFHDVQNNCHYGIFEAIRRKVSHMLAVA
jgi:hypothetical protein